MTKYHVTTEGEVKGCRARKNPCPYGGVTGEENHYNSKEEALKAVEEKYSNKTLTTTVRKHSKEKIAQVTKLLDELSMNPTVKDLSKLGEAFEDLYKYRLPQGLYTKERHQLTVEELTVAATEVAAAFKAVTETGGEVPNPVTGPHAKTLNEVVSVLPKAVKSFTPKGLLVTKTMGRNSEALAQYKYGNVVVGSTVYKEESKPRHSTPVGELYTNDAFSPEELESVYTGFTVSKHDDSGLEEQYWCGAKPEGKKDFKMVKVSDSTVIYVRGEKRVVNQPLYRLEEEQVALGNTITFPSPVLGKDSDIYKSTVLHEYTHSIQAGVRMRQSQTYVSKFEQEAFREFTNGERSYSGVYRMMVMGGFPDSYMGQQTGVELFTVSTEGLFYPQAAGKNFFYGSDRSQNADRVKAWVTGYWLFLDKLAKGTQ